VFGIANAWSGHEVRSDPAALAEDAVTLVRTHCTAHAVASFAARAKRSDKTYPMTSSEIERAVGGAVHEATGIAVHLDDPDLTVRIEIADGSAFVLLARVEGPGGLPVGVSGRVAVLCSSGFDSPVAAWRMMKRGAEVMLIHFHSYPYTSDASLRNVRAIAEVLAVWQGPVTLVTVPLIDLQKAVMLGAPHAFRVLLYRRAMVRIAERCARQRGAGALVTGENLGQVASQTLTNNATVDDAATLPVLRPLIAFDKQEIIRAAEEIGTAAISMQPYDDCCSLFVPEHPATSSHAPALAEIERTLDLALYEDRAFAAAATEIVAPSAA
ncbi:MAG: tRNA uracil 4-sulfurtransferase ThiI, partial [bacterium]|nr:tRNA uracil 4-sulfurtransferase ThiI [bacterium]